MASQAATMKSDAEVRPMSREERKVISPPRSARSSSGTTSISTARWPRSSAPTSSASYPRAPRNIFALLAFAAGFLVRPFGALVFGRLGDLVGRKYTFLITILIMGSSTFVVGLLPSSDTIGIIAPVDPDRRCACCRAWRSAASMAARRPTSPSMRRRAGAASTPP